MSVVESLLGLVKSQRARGLVIAADAAPQLVFADELRSLSMPAIPADTVAQFALEVSGDRDADWPARLETGAGDSFEVSIAGEGASLRLTFMPPGEEAMPPEETAGNAAPAPAEANPEAEAAAAPGVSEPSVPDVLLLDLLDRAERAGASDLLLSSGLPPRLRVGGALRELDAPPLDDQRILALLRSAASDLAAAALDERGSVDVALDGAAGPGGTRFRVNLFRQQRGLAAALRPIRMRPPTLAELNLPASLHALAEYPNGLVLLTGPTGSGKSTTLVALIEHLNDRSARHIVTLEDPIEYQYTPKRSLVHQRELGRHVPSFADGLRAALREDPDVILVGEMRDPETIAAALTAAETGHLVLSTLHSASPWMAIDRMIDVFPGDQKPQIRAQLAGVLRAVLSQHLLPSTSPPLRLPAYECLIVTGAAANQIREGKAYQLQSTIQTGHEDGMVSLESSLAALVRAGRLALPRAEALARDVDLLRELSSGSTREI